MTAERGSSHASAAAQTRLRIASDLGRSRSIILSASRRSITRPAEARFSAGSVPERNSFSSFGMGSTPCAIVVISFARDATSAERQGGAAAARASIITSLRSRASSSLFSPSSADASAAAAHRVHAQRSTCSESKQASRSSNFSSSSKFFSPVSSSSSSATAASTASSTLTVSFFFLIVFLAPSLSALSSSFGSPDLCVES